MNDCLVTTAAVAEEWALLYIFTKGGKELEDPLEDEVSCTCQVQLACLIA